MSPNLSWAVMGYLKKKQIEWHTTYRLYTTLAVWWVPVQTYQLVVLFLQVTKHVLWYFLLNEPSLGSKCKQSLQGKTSNYLQQQIKIAAINDWRPLQLFLLQAVQQDTVQVNMVTCCILWKRCAVEWSFEWSRKSAATQKHQTSPRSNVIGRASLSTYIQSNIMFLGYSDWSSTLSLSWHEVLCIVWVWIPTECHLQGAACVRGATQLANNSMRVTLPI